MSIAQSTVDKQQANNMVDMQSFGQGTVSQAFLEAWDTVNRFPDLKRAIDDGLCAQREKRKLDGIINEQAKTIKLLERRLERAQNVTPDSHEMTKQQISETLDNSPAFQDLLHKMESQRTYIEELRLTNQRLEERDQQHLEELAEEQEARTLAKRELEQERASHALTRQLYEQSEQRLELAQSLRQQAEEKHRQFYTWLQDLLRNKGIPAGEKGTAIALYTIFSALRDPITETELQVTLEEIASKSGKSTDAVSDHLEKFKHFNIITRRDPKFGPKDNPRTMVHITLHEQFLDAQHIDLNNKIGGKRKKKGDRYTVLHVPETGEIGIYNQPGTRKEADEREMIDDMIRKHKDRIPNALRGRQEHGQDPLTIDTPLPMSTSSQEITPKRADLREKMNEMVNQVDGELEAIRTERSNSVGQSAGQGVGNIERDYEQYPNATAILSDLAQYGRTIDFRPDGTRMFKRVQIDGFTPAAITREELLVIQQRIIEQDTELRTYLRSISESQHSEKKQVALSHSNQPAAQHSNTGSKASCSERKPVGLGVLCEACRYNEAYWISDKKYCNDCHEKKAVTNAK